TAMSGYIEALTDPSYAGQILVFTYPLMGNYGVAPDPGKPFMRAGFQAARPQVQGVVVQSYSPHFSHHLASRSLAQWLQESDIPLLTGIDTRTLTRKLREHGTMLGWVVPAGVSAEQARRDARSIEMAKDVFVQVAPSEVIRYDGGETRILLVDAGVKDG